MGQAWPSVEMVDYHSERVQGKAGSLVACDWFHSVPTAWLQTTGLRVTVPL